MKYLGRTLLQGDDDQLSSVSNPKLQTRIRPVPGQDCGTSAGSCEGNPRPLGGAFVEVLGIRTTPTFKFQSNVDRCQTGGHCLAGPPWRRE